MTRDKVFGMNDKMVKGQSPSRRKLKKDFLQLLATRELQEIFDLLSTYPKRKLLNPLFSTLCHNDEKVRWHGISCFGKLIPEIGRENFEDARVIMRRFLWSLNDESGGIGWGAPEAMSEIMVNDDRIRLEYLHMLLSYMREDGEEEWQHGNYLELPMLQRGLLWGIGRLCDKYPKEMKKQGVEDDLSQYLRSEDEQVRELALLALASLGVKRASIENSLLTLIENSSRSLRIYKDGVFQSISSSQIISSLRGKS